MLTETWPSLCALSIHPSTHRCTTCLFLLYLPTNLPTYLPTYLPTCRPADLPTCLPICLSSYRSLSRCPVLSVCRSVRPSDCQILANLTPSISSSRSLALALSFSLSLSLSLYLCLSAYLSIDLSIYLSICLSTSRDRNGYQCSLCVLNC